LSGILFNDNSQQDIVKEIFSDTTFNKKYHLGAVNSINWARILAQITYYFHAHFNLLRRTKSSPNDIKVQFVVPTGNFGDILAGYFAKQMGLPIAKLVVATNANDILDRFFKSGRYEKKPVHGAEAEGGEVLDGVKAHEDGAKETLSPAMDILVSSNFERLLWYLARECEAANLPEEQKSPKAGQVLKGWMDGVKAKGGIVVSDKVLKAAQRDFLSFRVSDDEVLSLKSFLTQTLATIADIYRASKYVLDPHTAVGVHAATELVKGKKQVDTHTISLSTAHPCKFSKAVNDALEKIPGYSWDDIIPADVRDLLVGKEQRVMYIPKANAEAVKEAIVKAVS
jgi:threonine synthase